MAQVAQVHEHFVEQQQADALVAVHLRAQHEREQECRFARYRSLAVQVARH